jgi:hypothetical protein
MIKTVNSSTDKSGGSWDNRTGFPSVGAVPYPQFEHLVFCSDTWLMKGT